MMLRTFVAIGLLLFDGSLSSSPTQEPPAAGPAPLAQDAPDSVAIFPWVFEKGTPAAQRTAREFLVDVFTKSLFFREDSYSIVSEAAVVKTWTQDLGYSLGEPRRDVPTPKQLLRLGQKLGVDWVVTGRAVWHTRSIWIGLGPKTKCDCTVDMLIVDVKKAEVSLDARRVVGNSTAKEDTLTAAALVLIGLVPVEGQFLTIPITAISGGPKTPREQTAVQLAIAKAIQPWLAVHPRHKKIDAGD